MTRKEQRIAAVEKKLEHIDDPMGLIICPPGHGEPERSIKRFMAQYPYYDGALIVLPDNGRDTHV